jgi:hypothetical protein
MTSEHHYADEIARLQGELSAATNAIALLFELLSLGDDATITTFRNKIIAAPLDTTSGAITENRYWRQGVTDFTERLTKSFPSHIA